MRTYIFLHSSSCLYFAIFGDFRGSASHSSMLTRSSYIMVLVIKADNSDDKDQLLQCIDLFKSLDQHWWFDLRRD